MARIPAVKRRRLTPPITDGEDSSPSTLEAEPEENAFFKQASSWNLEQDYETKPRKGKKKDKERCEILLLNNLSTALTERIVMRKVCSSSSKLGRSHLCLLLPTWVHRKVMLKCRYCT